jgi:hypothetical protein
VTPRRVKELRNQLGRCIGQENPYSPDLGTPPKLLDGRGLNGYRSLTLLLFHKDM